MQVVRTKHYTDFKASDHGFFSVRINNDCSQLKIETENNGEFFTDIDKKELRGIRDMINQVLGDTVVTVTPKKAEATIIQSAFHFPNGKRIIVYTAALHIKTFECDENWQPHSKPLADCPLAWSGESAKEYHLHLRNQTHKPEYFDSEHSTNIDW